MKVFWILHELWSGLTPRIKIMIVMGLVALASGVPMSEMGWEWRWTHQIFQMQNCVDDFTSPLMSAVERGDLIAIENASSADKATRLSSCGTNAIQHPKGTVSFVVDQYRRRPALESGVEFSLN
jgi:hypothetical protein